MIIKREREKNLRSSCIQICIQITKKQNKTKRTSPTDHFYVLFLPKYFYKVGQIHLFWYEMEPIKPGELQNNSNDIVSSSNQLAKPNFLHGISSNGFNNPVVFPLTSGYAGGKTRAQVGEVRPVLQNGTTEYKILHTFV